MIKTEVMSLAVALPDQLEPLQPFAAAVRVDTELKPESVRLNFVMLGMDMGRNVYSLQPDDEFAVWSGQSLVLPVCVTGRSDWRAEVLITAEGVEYEAWFDFVVN